MSRIPEDVVSSIKEFGNDNIVKIIGEYVKLKKNGATFTGCCPFHTEKTGSFTVNPVRQTCHCFGCGEGGNVVTFIMKHQKLSYPAALEHLARKGGIIIPTGESKEEKERKAMLLVLSKATIFYQDCLRQNKNGAKAYVEGRMSEDLAKQFAIGFAPSGGKVLVEYLEKNNLPLWAAEKAGLLRKEENGSYKDYFWNRIMFPIRNAAGYTIGFAGRIMTLKTKMKYINSPETPLYKKTAVLYGIDMAIEEIKKTGIAFVVEGYLDLIQMWAAGIRNVVATCGTAFTKDHAAYLKRYCRKLNLMFDGDAPGIKALQKAILLTAREEMTPVTYNLPEGLDPDDYFKNGGKLEDIKIQSGFDFLQATGIEMSPTIKQLHQREKLERGVIYMTQHIPAVAQLLKKRGNLDELFGPDALLQIMECINKSKD